MVPETSVEKAFNSRCSSSNDQDQRHGHWGIYDHSTPLAEESLKQVQRATEIPRFTSHKLLADFSAQPVSVLMQPGLEGIESEWLNIESGVQQQAIYVAGAASLGLAGVPAAVLSLA